MSLLYQWKLDFARDNTSLSWHFQLQCFAESQNTPEWITDCHNENHKDF